MPAAAQKKGCISKTETVQSKLTPKEVIDNYFKALGGKDKLDAVKSTITDNTVAVQGMEIQMTTKKLGNKFKSVQSFMGKEMVQLFLMVKKDILIRWEPKQIFLLTKLLNLKRKANGCFSI